MIKAANVLGLPEVNATVIDERLARNLADRLLDRIDEFADAGWERIPAIIRRRQGSSRIGSRNRAMKKAIRQVFGSFIVEEVEIDAGYFCAMPTILVNMETDQRRLGFHTFRIDKRKEPMEGVLNCEITYHAIWRFIQRNGFSVEAFFQELWALHALCMGLIFDGLEQEGSPEKQEAVFRTPRGAWCILIDQCPIVTTFYTADESWDLDPLTIRPARPDDVRERFARQSLQRGWRDFEGRRLNP